METAPSPFKQAKQLEKEGRFGEAAAIFEHSGDLDRAITNYTKAGHVDRAADLLKVNGRGAKAAELYESVGQHAKAAVIYEEIFEFAPAGAAFVKAGEPERAAAMYEQADAFEQAATLYADLGNLKKAAQLYERAGNAAKAAELNASVAQQANANPEAELDLSAGVVDAAKVVAAIVTYLRTDRPDDAAHLYGSCQEKIGYPVLAAIAGDADAEHCAAEMFVCTNDFAMAAQVFENLADYQSAAAMYERADDPYVAAEMFIRVGDTARAAEMYEKSGHFRQAAECFTASGNAEKSAVCYEKAEDNFLAGKLYASLGKPNRALQLLQKVRKGDADYLEASRLIGEGLVAGGHPELAAKKLLEATDGAELTEKSAPVFYALAAAQELMGSASEALTGWERLAAWNINWADVKARIEALKSKGAPAARPAAAKPAPARPRPGPAGPGAPPPRTAPANLVTVLDGFEFLKGTPLFKELTLDEMKAVYHACETRRFAPGEVLIEQDRPGEALFVLRKGTARVLRATADGATEQVARLGPGSPAGDMALVDDSPTSARVVAESEVEAFCIDRVGFEKLMASSDRMAVKLYRFFVRTLSKRLRQTSQVLAATAARGS